MAWEPTTMVSSLPTSIIEAYRNRDVCECRVGTPGPWGRPVLSCSLPTRRSPGAPQPLVPLAQRSTSVAAAMEIEEATAA
jgi:hypothetical protein